MNRAAEAERRERSSRSPRPVILDAEVGVVGSGFCGLAMGIRLKQAGIPFVILEKADDLGGTWRDNTYPGIAVDITSFTYSFSFEQNPEWSRVFAPGSELKRYADDVAERYGLRPHLRFGKQVVDACFDPETDTWMLTFADGGRFRCRYLVNACGVLHQPKTPDIPGLASFRGKTIHTARWDHGHSLDGKRVAVIGTGATAVQLVPSIADRVASLSVFQRTPIWIFPKPDAPIPEPVKWAFREVGGLQKAVRLGTSALTELLMVVGVVYNKQTPYLVRAAEAACRSHLRAQVPDPELRAKLTPHYGFFCKRPSFSNDFYPTFSKPHVELVTEGIERITETGIVTTDGRERSIDTLILATGFLVMEKGNMPSFPTRGLEGTELGDYWAENRFQAYEGIAVPRFPNHWILVGPYSVTGASWFSIAESGSRHVVRCLEEARRLGRTRVEVTEEAHGRYFDQVQARMRNTVFFNAGCAGSNSYYFDARGDAPLYRPAGAIEQWWRSGHFPLADYAMR